MAEDKKHFLMGLGLALTAGLLVAGAGDLRVDRLEVPSHRDDSLAAEVLYRGALGRALVLGGREEMHRQCRLRFSTSETEPTLFSEEIGPNITSTSG